MKKKCKTITHENKIQKLIFIKNTFNSNFNCFNTNLISVLFSISVLGKNEFYKTKQRNTFFLNFFDWNVPIIYLKHLHKNYYINTLILLKNNLPLLLYIDFHHFAWSLELYHHHHSLQIKELLKKIKSYYEIQIQIIIDNA